MIVILNKQKIKNIEQVVGDISKGTLKPKKIEVLDERRIFPWILKRNRNEQIIVINRDIKVTKGLLKRLVGFSNRNPNFAIGVKGLQVSFAGPDMILNWFEGHKIKKALPVDILTDCILTKSKFHLPHSDYDELYFSLDCGINNTVRLLIPTANLQNKVCFIDNKLLERYIDEIKGGAKKSTMFGGLIKR